MKHFKVFFAVICLTLSVPLYGTENSVLFTVDLDKLLRASNFGKSIIRANNSARKALQNENEKLEAELLSEEKELSNLRKSLSADDFRIKAIEFDEKVTNIRRQQSEKEKSLVEGARKEEAVFLKQIYPLLYELLSQRGGSVLVDQRNVILWDNSVDLTDDTIEVINRTLGNGISNN